MVVIQVIIYFLFRRLSKSHKPISWGIVKDFLTGKGIKKTIVRVFDTRFNKLLDTQVTDNDGKYGFLVSKGEYYMTGHHENYEAFKSRIYDLTQKDAAYLAEEIRMRKIQVTSNESNLPSVTLSPEVVEGPKETQSPASDAPITAPQQSSEAINQFQQLEHLEPRTIKCPLKVQGKQPEELKEEPYDLDVLNKE
ncbi:MAG: hypothetical protein UT02_C0050G0001 [Parcubacteria group bacterium GW2011_GWC2_38_7]|nr:MAG: hypothetical protein UT02_C0050G0001 [Parcubacteria group bacterium GW2011_GWC2_38_7]